MNFEQYQSIGKEIRDEKAKRHEYLAKVRYAELSQNNAEFNNQNILVPKPEAEHNHPYVPNKGLIITLYIICMIASLIFREFWILWIVLTAVFIKLMVRHKNNEGERYI